MPDEPQAPSQGNETPPAPAEPQATPEPAPEAAPPILDTPPQPAEPPPSDPNSEQETPAERIVPASDGYQFEEEVPTQMGEIFNKLDMTQEQANGIIALDKTRVEATAQATLQAGQKLVEEWGDVAKTNMNLARRGRDYFDPTGGLKEMLNASGMGNDPKVLSMFLEFGKRMEEGGFLPSEVNTPPQNRSAADVLYGDQGK